MPDSDILTAPAGTQALHRLLRERAHLTPDKPAYLWYGRALSFAELNAASDAFAAELAARGLVKGDRVALFLNNCPQYVVAHYGAQKLGAIVCPISPLNKAHELRYQLADQGARAIVAAEDLLGLVGEVRADTALEQVYAVRYDELLPAQPALVVPEEMAQARTQPWPAGTLDFWALCQSGLPAPEVAIDPAEDVALLTYTSGTTGLPKGAMLTYGNAHYKTVSAVQMLDVHADDCILAVAPLYHIAGMSLGLNQPIASGATTVLLYRFDPLAVLQAIDRHRVSWWYSIAPMNVAVMAPPEAAQHDLSSLRANLVTSFGIQFTEALADRWRGIAPNCQSAEAAYGLSETHTFDTCMPPGAVRWGTQGQAIPGNEVQVVDPDTGTPMPVGEQGEIIIRGPGNFKGYWRKPEATAQTLRDGWVHTGDMGRLDSEGYLTFLGRFKEMIKVSGYSVFPEEVESLFIRHPEVAQVAVIGVADPVKGEVVKAFIVPKAGAQPEPQALQAWARENMAAYKVPRDIELIAALPTTGAGKVLRRLLKTEA